MQTAKMAATRQRERIFTRPAQTAIPSFRIKCITSSLWVGKQNERHYHFYAEEEGYAYRGRAGYMVK